MLIRLLAYNPCEMLVILALEDMEPALVCSGNVTIVHALLTIPCLDLWPVIMTPVMILGGYRSIFPGFFFLQYYILSSYLNRDVV